ncbi:MAG: DNA polymerase III subunit gamma/tau [Bacteroidia bacterium]|nr:DNA polymerase III subunit gamma/tau [Bacteroidia bacterium]
MSDFIVSARKYRPATFDTVVGQGSITSTLKNAIKNHHLAQAFLFCGPRGVGKTTCARILAKTINCFSPTPATEACNQCESCKSFNSGQSLNVYELDAASNNSVDDIRALIEQVRFAPQLGQYKVYIIDEVHMLSAAAFNAFLKTLEEPPKHAIFILATTEKHKIIPTILSRCQIFDFSRIRIEDIANHLLFVAKSEGIEADPEALHLIAQKADGALRDALSIFDQLVSFAGQKITYQDVLNNLNILDYDYYFSIVQHLLEGNIPKTLLLFDDILQKGFDGHHFVSGLAGHFRNLMVCKDSSTLQLLEVGTQTKDKYRQQCTVTSVPFIMKALDALSRTDVGYKTARNPRLLVELTLMQIASINQVAAAPEKKKPELKEEKSGEQGSGAEHQGKKNEVSAGSLHETQAITASESSGSKEEKQPAAKNTFKSSAFSLHSLMGEKKKEEQKIRPEEVLVQMTEPVTQEQLEEKWAYYADLMKQNNKINLFSTLTNRKPVLREDMGIAFDIDNKVQEEEMLNEKPEILAFLRKELKNSGLHLILNITRNEADKRPYTPSEKFKRMAEKNPLLHRLKQEFDLDIEY